MAIDDITLNVASICNLSLSHLGMKPITDLTTDVALNNPSALALNRQWGPSRNEVLGEIGWPFATVQARIYHRTAITSDDYPEWEFFTTYPASALTVWNVFDTTTVETKYENDFEIFYNPTLLERIICCDLDTVNAAYCEYSHNVTDTLLWDTKFVMAFSYKLATAICMELTGDSKLTLELSNAYSILIGEAKRIAHAEEKKKPTQSNPIVESRG